MYYYRNRWYDPEIGRFISEDPIGFAGGDVNLYSYVWNSPYNFIDPFGFQGSGEKLADLLDNKIEKARLGAQGDASNWVWNATVNTLADLARIGSDVLRLGSGIGCALFNDRASASDKAWAVADDIGRGLTIPGAGIAAKATLRAAKGVGKAISKARPPKGIGKEIGILREAAKGKGNFGLGSATRAEADRLGKAWVGHGARVSSNGKALISKDGLRQYRPPSYKSRLGKTQANFERRFPGQRTRRWQSNAHLDITD